METRKLTTILFADIAGYTALMQEDESKALGFLNRFKEILEHHSAENQGNIVQYFGDGCLMSFDSSWHCVSFAKSIQKELQKANIPVRIGMHLGDVVFKDGNVFGDGVNVASRIESLGIPGSILMSGPIRDQIKNKKNTSLSSLGTFDFKNVYEPMEVFAISDSGFVVPDRKSMTGKLKQKNQIPDWTKWAIASLVLFLMVLSFALYRNTNKAAKANSGIPKLAIIPFVHKGDMDDKIFRETLEEELNTRLTGLQKLALISRSSSSKYADSEKNISEIGKELDVDYLLEGTIYKISQKNGGSSISITPSLVNVAENVQIWSKTFQSDMNDVQNIQSEITNELLRALNVALTSEEKSMLASTLTDNKLAYDAYNKGLKIHPPGHGSEKDFRTAFKMYSQAVKLDPSFAHAWLRLGYAYKDLYWFGYEAYPYSLDSAMACTIRARKLKPNLPEVTIALGDHYYRMREYDKALSEFSKVMDKRPNDSGLLQRIGEVWRRQGLFDEAIEMLEKGLSLDPINVNSITELSWTYIFVGNFERALELQERAQKYNPDAEWNHLIGAFIHWTRGNDNDLQIAKKLLENVPNPQSDYPAYFWVTQSIFENDPQGVLRLVDNLSVPAIELQSAYYPVDLVAGMSHLELGETQKANKELDSAVSTLLEEIEANPSDFRMRMGLGLAYAALGKKEDAIAAGLAGTNLLPLEEDSLLGLDILYDLMRIYAILGEDDLALDVMAKLISVPCQYRGLFFTANPDFAQLQENSRFKDLMIRLNKMKEKSLG